MKKIVEAFKEIKDPPEHILESRRMATAIHKLSDTEQIETLQEIRLHLVRLAEKQITAIKEI